MGRVVNLTKCGQTLGEVGGGGGQNTKGIHICCIHRGIWSTMHCRLCISCYGNGSGSVIINAKKTVHCSRNSSMVVSHRQAKGGLAFGIVTTL